jgi:hypothetical protein
VLKTALITSVFCVLALLAVDVSAEMKTFVREYTYQASEADSKQSCRILATEQVKRMLLEELGTYLESHTEVVDKELTKDQINTMTAGIVKTSIVAEKWDGQNYWLQAKMDVEPDDVAKSINRISQDKQQVSKLESDKRQRDKTVSEIDSLKKDMETGKDNPQKIKEYNEKVQQLKMLQGMSGVFKAMAENKPEQGIGTFFDVFGEMIKNSQANQ